MGVKTLLNLQEINDALKNYVSFSKITSSEFGNTDTVYLCDDKYVLKLYEQSSLKQISQEIAFHREFKDFSELKISKLFIEKIFTIKNKPFLVFEKSNGIVIKKIQNNHIIQIAKFLSNFHKKSKEYKTTNKNIYDKGHLKSLILSTNNRDFLEIYESLDVDFQDDGLIHGDLFVDNAIFKDDILEAVIDFNEACRGDFIFDLSVVVVSWCRFTNEQFDKDIEMLIVNYDKNISKDILLKYTKYACLYYSVTRSLENRDYSDLMSKYKFLEKLKG